MASFFKGCCLFYWLAWLICISYYFGTAIFSADFILNSIETHQVFSYVTIICFFNIGMSVLGCIFVKCNITHILCAALYILPLIGVNFTFSILGILTIRKVTNPTENDVIKFINDTNNKKGDYPNWLHNTQHLMECCGVFSYLDYPIIFRNSMTLSGVVPSSCCPRATRNPDDCNLRLDSPHKNTSTVNELFGICMRDEQNASDIYKGYGSLELEIHPIQSIENLISTCGCFEKILEHLEGFLQSHFIFFLFMLGMSVIMAFVYLRVWCRNQGSDMNTGSDHGLDIEIPPSISEIIAASEPVNPDDDIPKIRTPVRLRAASLEQQPAVGVPHRVLVPTSIVTQLRRGTTSGQGTGPSPIGRKN